MQESGIGTTKKKRGLANYRYLRFENHWVLFATDGTREEFTKRNRGRIVDVTRGAFQFHGYSIGYRPGGYERIPKELRGEHNALWADYRRQKERGEKPKRPPSAKRDHRYRASVRIEQGEFEKLHAYFTGIATSREAGTIVGELWELPYEPYAPVREQLKKILRDVNENRKRAGYARIPYTALRYKRRIVRAFDWPNDVQAA